MQACMYGAYLVILALQHMRLLLQGIQLDLKDEQGEMHAFPFLQTNARLDGLLCFRACSLSNTHSTGRHTITPNNRYSFKFVDTYACALSVSI